MKLRAVILFAVLGGVLQAQQPVGSVAVGDAVVAGNLSVTNGRAVLVSNSTVTATDHAADISLDRGGNVLVCATSGLHITSGKAAAGATPLMLSLDRGAIELRMSATASDVIMTPDLHLVACGVHASDRARLASDHLPIWARLNWIAGERPSAPDEQRRNRGNIVARVRGLVGQFGRIGAVGAARQGPYEG